MDCSSKMDLGDIGNDLGTLEEEALKRKERLKLLRKKYSGAPAAEERPAEKDGQQQQQGQATVALPKPKFRSYRPIDSGLKENVLPEAKPANIEEEIKDQLQAARSRLAMEELDITSLAPRKPDWDLKRDVARKLEKLERRTQKAIAELIRDRLRQRQGQEDLAAAVGLAGPRPAR